MCVIIMQLENHAQLWMTFDLLEGQTSTRVGWRFVLQLLSTALCVILAGTTRMLKLSADSLNLMVRGMLAIVLL